MENHQNVWQAGADSGWGEAERPIFVQFGEEEAQEGLVGVFTISWKAIEKMEPETSQGVQWKEAK